VLAFLLAALDVAVWVLRWRIPGAALGGLSIGLALLPPLIAPVASASRVARQMAVPQRDPRSLTDLDPQQVAWGLTLVTLWRLRWLILAGLLLTPVLLISLLRLDAASFEAWRASAEALGGATEAARARWLLPDGGIPYFRLALRALSGALLPWAALPLLASLGVTAALALGDASLAPLAALLGEALTLALLGAGWGLLSTTPALAGSYEVLRLLLLAALIAAPGLLARRVNAINAELLLGEEESEQVGGEGEE
jgi:hypothetical protein